MPDLEDSVPDDEKANAREVTASFLPQLAQVGPLVIPRVNALETGLCEADLEAVVGPHIDGVSMGKIYSVQDVQTISDWLCSALRWQRYHRSEIGTAIYGTGRDCPTHSGNSTNE